LIFYVEAHKRILLNLQDLRSYIHRHINPRPLLDLLDLNGVRQAALHTEHHLVGKLLNSITRIDLMISKLFRHKALNKFRHMNIEREHTLQTFRDRQSRQAHDKNLLDTTLQLPIILRNLGQLGEVHHQSRGMLQCLMPVIRPMAHHLQFISNTNRRLIRHRQIEYQILIMIHITRHLTLVLQLFLHLHNQSMLIIGHPHQGLDKSMRIAQDQLVLLYTPQNITGQLRLYRHLVKRHQQSPTEMKLRGLQSQSVIGSGRMNQILQSHNT
jgi:hypothetical protein